MQQPMQYPIALFKNNDSFHVTVPDLPDVKSKGKDMADAIYNTRLAVSHYLYDLVQKNLPIPQPSPISKGKREGKREKNKNKIKIKIK